MGFMTWIRTQWDRAAALGAVLIGLLAFLLGWRGVSGEAYVAKQLPYIVSGALFGIFMAGIASALWLSADLRDEWRELRAVRHLLRDQNQRLLNGAPEESLPVQSYDAPVEVPQSSYVPAEVPVQSYATEVSQPLYVAAEVAQPPYVPAEVPVQSYVPAPAPVPVQAFVPADVTYPTAELPSLHTGDFSQ